jgi:hypothetical protein
MTDTIHNNGSHDVHDLDESSVDADVDAEELRETVRINERRRVRFEARKREVNKEMAALRDKLAVITAEIGRCNRQIALAEGELSVRGRKKSGAQKTTGRK